MGKSKYFPEIDIKIEEQSDTFLKLVAEPFERGYGVTVGNALRRVLLTAMPGAAITSVRLENVYHEFTSIDGVIEDVTDIVLNLKKVRFKLNGTGPELVNLYAKGPYTITGADIAKLSSEFEVLNPDTPIATITDEIELNMEIRIARGKGYVSADRNKQSDNVIGTIYMDSIFNPIQNVSWKVQPIPTSIDGHEKLLLEIISDGSTSPKDAVNHAATILREQMVLFLFNDSSSIRVVNDEELNEAMEMKNLLNKSIDEMELSVRSYNCLQAAGIKYIGELVTKQENEMLKFKNFGRKSLNELNEKLVSMNLSFGMDLSNNNYLDEE